MRFIYLFLDTSLKIYCHNKAFVTVTQEKLCFSVWNLDLIFTLIYEKEGDREEVLLKEEL